MDKQTEVLAASARRDLGSAALSELLARYERAELSEGQLCKLLGLDRIETRGLVDAFRAIQGPAKNHVCGTPDAMCDTNCMRANDTWPMCAADCERMERAAEAIERLNESNEALTSRVAELEGALERVEKAHEFGHPMLKETMRAIARAALAKSTGGAE